MMADGLASAVSVLGPKAGIRLLDHPQHSSTEGYIMFAKEETDELRAVESSGMRNFLIDVE
jgi:thiamine biosynthesis lipoprotein ApbE